MAKAVPFTTKMTTEEMIRLMSASSSGDILMARQRLIELTEALKELRDEIIPNWSKREAIAFIDETLTVPNEQESK